MRGVRVIVGLSGLAMLLWTNPLTLLLFVTFLGWAWSLGYIIPPRPPSMERESPLATGIDPAARRHIQQMIQKQKDQELMEFVGQGHQAWAAKQEAARKMRKAAMLQRSAAGMQATLPMGRGSGMQRMQIEQQAAWTNSSAAMQMADAADLMLDAATENDPFEHC